MTSPRWNTLVSGVVLTLALAVGGPAQAQRIFDGMPSIPSSFDLESSFCVGDGSGVGLSFFNNGYSSFGLTGYGYSGGMRGFPLPGYGFSNREWPQTTTSFQADSSTNTPLRRLNSSTNRGRRRQPRAKAGRGIDRTRDGKRVRATSPGSPGKG